MFPTDGTESAGNAATQAEPQQKVEGATGQQTSPDYDTLMKKVEALDATVRTLQSGKDKGIKRVETQLEEFAPLMQQVRKLMEQGVTDPNAIERELEYSEMRRRVLGTPVPQQAAQEPVTGGTVTASGMDVVAQQVATGLGMSIDDPQVASIIREKAGADAVIALADLAKTRASAPVPKPSTTPTVTGGTVQSADDALAAKIAHLDELQKNPSAHRQEILALKKELGW